jgi:hypothetical protein
MQMIPYTMILASATREKIATGMDLIVLVVFRKFLAVELLRR